MRAKCRICGGVEIRKYGSVNCYSNKLNYNPSVRRTLFKCVQCKSISVEPLPTREELSSYYDNYSTIKNEECGVNRSSLPIIRQLAELLRSGKVLDLGCGFGDVLATLPSSFKKVGLDVSLDACKEAKRKGIDALCADWELAAFKSEFDLVIALDFVEHVDNASKVLNTIGKFLKSGGFVVLETGNADSWAAKILGEDWSYPAIYGHLQVLSPYALMELAKSAQIETISLIKGRHSPVSLNQALHRGILAYGFHFLKLASLILKPVTGSFYPLHNLINRTPPASNFKDHMVLVGQRK